MTQKRSNRGDVHADVIAGGSWVGIVTMHNNDDADPKVHTRDN
jgi:hypothetical protein